MAVFLADLSDPSHQAAIVALLDMYCRDQFGDGKPLSDDAREKLIGGLLEHGGARVFLAYEGEQAVGVAVCFVGFSTFRGRPLLNIHDIAVAPEARGHGIGWQLLMAVEQHAREQAYCKVTLEVRADNRRAQEIYRRAGFQSTKPETWFWTRTLD
jgi:ribosomal protein S18 acetylase RimI-like enzyme